MILQKKKIGPLVADSDTAHGASIGADTGIGIVPTLISGNKTIG